MELAHSTILHAFLDVCEREPHRPCLTFEKQQWDYQDLWHTSSQWAELLRMHGVGRGDRVALYLDNGPSFLMAYLGTWMNGACAVLVNHQYRQRELLHILRDSGACLCVTNTSGLHEISAIPYADIPTLTTVLVTSHTQQITTTVHRNVLQQHQTPTELPPPIQNPTMPAPADLALLAYTSGTTGTSKGAMLLHQNLIANSMAVTTAWHWTHEDRLLLTLPLFHVHGLAVGTHGTWLCGGSMELHRSFDATITYQRLMSGDVTMFFGVPTMYVRLLDVAQQYPDHQPLPSSVRLCVSGSAPLSSQTFHAFSQHLGHSILERYGMTETLMNLTNPYHGERRPGTVGMPFPGQEARIADLATLQPVSNGTIGEIQVRGPNVFAGYWQRSEATAQAFTPDGWFRTGDLGWQSDDGYYTITGRAHDLIITGGYNVYPHEVEEVLRTHPTVADAAVLGLPHDEFGEQVVAVIVPVPSLINNLPPNLAASLAQHCQINLAPYKKPRRITFANALPRNALGKVQKHVLRQELGGECTD